MHLRDLTQNARAGAESSSDESEAKEGAREKEPRAAKVLRGVVCGSHVFTLIFGGIFSP